MTKNRKHFLCVLRATLCSSWLFLFCFSASSAAPNVIFILADDLGYGDLGCYGQQKIKTPNLDRMAAEGIRFTQAYAGSTVCAPSRSVLMTGQHGGHTRIRSNAVTPLQPEDVTVAEVMKSVGYRTGLIGKWGLGDPGTISGPNEQGFDYFYGYANHLHAHNHYPTWLWRNAEKVPIQGNDEVAKGVCGTCTHYALDLFTAEARQFIAQPSEQPYFLYLPYVTPHANNERFGHDGNGMEVPDYGEYTDRDWPPQQKGHAAMITRMDLEIGSLLESLRASGQDKNTVVFFASDNGAMHEGGALSDFFNSSGPLRGHKRSLHDGGIRTPLIAWSPGRIPAGRTSDHVCAIWDILPTLAELSNASLPDHIDGVSLVPTLLDQSGQQEHDHLYWEFHEGGFMQAVRQGNWKAIRRNLGTLKLYNLATDIHEDNDLAAAHPEVAAKMTELLDNARTESKDYPTPARPGKNEP
jgi:arylsulfatase A-like enzyme